MGFDGLGILAAPLAAAYHTGVVLRRWTYDHGLAAVMRPRIRTISIGGLEAGGSGKTPVAGLVLAALVAAGKRPGLLTRGYHRANIDLQVRPAGQRCDPDRIGDEPAMLVEQGLDVPVAACTRRKLGAAALDLLGCQSLVLDDGFAHRQLCRDVDIVVLRGERPFGNGHLLPWGTLREPISSLSRAHVVWLHFATLAETRVPAWWMRHCPRAVRVVSESRLGPVTDLGGREVSLDGCRIVAAAGIARPENFFASLVARRAQLCASLTYRDHHRYGPADVAALEKAMLAHHAEAVVVTAKDAIKLRRLWRQGPVFVAEHAVHVVYGTDDLARVLGLDRGMNYFS